MSAELYTLILAGAFLLVFAMADAVHVRLNVNAEYTRKFVHISSGLIILLFPVLIDNLLLVGILCGAFIVLLFVSLYLQFFQGIHGVSRKTYGSFLYPVSVFGSYLFYDAYDILAFFYLPVLILAVCDPVAALVGKKTGGIHFKIGGHRKTLGGSLGFFGSALIISVLTFALTSNPITGSVILTALIISLTSAISEAFVHKGYDNLTIPGTVILTLFIIHESKLLCL